MKDKKQELLTQIQGLVREYFEADVREDFVPGSTTVSLIDPPYSWQEVNEAIDSLLSVQITLNQTVGNKIQRFENAWSDYIGTRHGIMVNSGSSANLLALFALSNPQLENPIRHGDEVITNAVTWNTTVSPILAVGAVPVLVDVRLSDCTIDVDAIEAAITPKTKAIMPVHLIGNPCSMDAILDIAKRHGLYVIEDVCEAHGAKFGDRRCGSMGDIGTFSFFFSHHITTMEGGMLMTNNDEIDEIVRVMRSQGVIRNVKKREELEAYYKGHPDFADIDERYLFANIGFNLRPTELNGGFGIEQLKKFPDFLDCRSKNGRYWLDHLSKFDRYFSFPVGNLDECSWFCFPLIVKDDAPFSRDQIRAYLDECKIESRPIMSGDVSAQPAMALYPHVKGDLTNAKVVHRNGFFWGNHQGIDQARREYVVQCIEEFIAKWG